MNIQRSKFSGIFLFFSLFYAASGFYSRSSFAANNVKSRGTAAPPVVVPLRGNISVNTGKPSTFSSETGDTEPMKEIRTGIERKTTPKPKTVHVPQAAIRNSPTTGRRGQIDRTEWRPSRNNAGDHRGLRAVRAAERAELAAVEESLQFLQSPDAGKGAVTQGFRRLYDGSLAVEKSDEFKRQNAAFPSNRAASRFRLSRPGRRARGDILEAASSIVPLTSNGRSTRLDFRNPFTDNPRAPKSSRGPLNDEVALLKYAAANFANGLTALSDDMTLMDRLKMMPPPLESRLMTLADNLDPIRNARDGQYTTTIKAFEKLIFAVLNRITQTSSSHRPDKVQELMDKLSGALMGLSQGTFKNSVEFISAAEKKLAAVQYEESSIAAKFVGAIGFSLIMLSAFDALSNLIFAPLPTAFRWSLLTTTHVTGSWLAQALPWALVNVGLTFISLLNKERYHKFFSPINDIPPLVLYPLLPLMAWLEELIFRLGLMGGTLWLLTGMLSTPMLPATLLASVFSSIIFARVHGYGPSMPRFIGGMLFGYVALTQGYLMASLVHTLSNAILITLSTVTSTVQKLAARNVPTRTVERKIS